jgi:type IV pilus assembly protein PilB
VAEAKKIGEMLKEAGLIDDFQLETALSHQRNWGGKLGAILIELAFVKEDDVSRVVAQKLHIPHVNLFEPEVPEEVFKLIKPETAKKYHVLPVKKDGSSLVLAMRDPLDIEAMDEIRFITGLTIKPSLALESEIKDAIRKYYDGEIVVRTQAQSPFQPGASSDGRMEVFHGIDIATPKEVTSAASSPLQSGDGTEQHVPPDDRMRLDAIITLLIEKKIISREEIANMIFQKKIGL